MKTRKGKEMKKSFLFLLILCLVLSGLFVSCNSEAVLPAEEGLASVVFDNNSKAITANLPAFNAGDYYWFYAAEKADSSRMTSGKTETYDSSGAVPVKKDSSDNPVCGLGTVSGFSQGLWNFKLFAYKNSNKTGLVFQGETVGVTLKSSSTNAVSENVVHIVVFPISDSVYGPGSLLIKGFSFEGFLGNSFVEYVPTSGGSISSVDYDPTNGVEINSLNPGAYTVTVKYRLLGDENVYTKGTVVVTVYSNLKTTVTEI